MTRRDEANRALSLSLAALGSLTPVSSQLSRATVALPALSPQLVVDFLRRHKVRAIAASRLAVIGDEATSALLRPVLDRREQREVALARAQEDLRDAAHETGVRYGLIKGLAARALYDEPALRDVGDVDTFVDSQADCLRIARSLLRSGYVHDTTELPWVKADWSGSLFYGQIRLKSRATSAPGFIDLHYGGYSVRHAAVVPVRVAELVRDESGLADPAWNLGMSVANAAGDDFVTVKDLNDLALCLAQNLDWDIVLRFVRAACLERFFAAMLESVADTSELSPSVEFTRRDLIRRLRVNCVSGERRPSLWAPSWRWRQVNTVIHSARVAARYEPPALLRAVVSAALYYRRPLRLEVTTASRRPWRIPRPLDPTRCVRLVPPEALPGGSQVRPSAAAVPRSRNGPLGEAYEVVATDAGDVVRSGDLAYVPTIYYRIDSSRVEEVVGS